MICMNPIKVTVIVPVYNTHEKFLKECLTSLIGQTLKNIEIIFVDDGSESKTAEFLEQLAVTDERIRVFHKKNGGVSSARNFGLNQAVGEYITFLDADDWLDLSCLEEAYRLAVKNKADMVGWRFVREYEKKVVEPKVFSEDHLIYSVNKKKMTYPIFDMRVMGYTTMKLYRRTVIGDKRYDEHLTNGEDVELNFRLYRDIQCAVYLNRPYYHYRFVSGSAVRGYHSDLLEKYNATLRAIKNHLPTVNNKNMKQAYMDFTAISYLMISLNYVFCAENKKTFREKLQQLKEISESKPYADMIQMAERLQMPLSRKAAVICAKYHFYYGVWLVMKVKHLLDKSYG